MVRVLVVNAGSSSLKLRVIGAADEVLAADDVARAPGAVGERVERFLADARNVGDVDAVGHRVVHGGAAFEHPLVLDAGADAALARLAELAPLHNPPALEAIHELRRRRPELTQVACFDTSFHVTMPARASTYALPVNWRREWGIRRFGFHGLSHSWASRRTAEILGANPATLRLVTAHVGSGASLAAVRGGRSVDTTMGFTPMEGLVMATRAGSVDPGALVWALRRGLDADGLERALERESGLLGLSGRSGDLREVLAGVDDGDADCLLAYEVYVHRLQTGIGAMAVAAGGIDALTFTGGAGEASGRLRSDVCAGLGALGVAALAADEPITGDRVLQPAGQPGIRGGTTVHSRGPAVVVVTAREDLEIARAVRAVLGHGAG